PEVDAEGGVLQLEPRPADAGNRPAAADVIDRRQRLHCQARVPERVRPDEQTQPDSRRRLGEGRERRVALDDRLVRVAEDRVDVVPCPERVEAQLLGAGAGGEERGPVAGLAPEVDSELDVSHGAPPSSGERAWAECRSWLRNRMPTLSCRGREVA